ncbi:NUDIX domain-containing protein [Streptomyces longwoodensis]|uniref:NUDIX hydrolase n=1 Tax=Streptomyces longwoodensis TaxID=68231 RepID=UPI0038687343
MPKARRRPCPQLFREAVEAYLGRHPDKYDALAGLLAAIEDYLTAEQRPALALREAEVAGAQWLSYADVRSPTLRAELLAAEADGLDGRPGPVLMSALIRRHAAEHPPTVEKLVGTDPLSGEAPTGTELHIVGVHLHLQDDQGRILLGLRHPDSAFAPNTWHFLAGHCERETAIDCLVREAEEEAGLTIAPEDVDLVHTVHHVDSPTARPRIALVFQARTWTGDPEVLEPDRCVEWRWWKPQDLPDALVPYTRRAIEGIRRGRRYSEQGWGER